MPKRKISKAATKPALASAAEEAAVVAGPEKHSSTSKKGPSNEIDEIFAGKKRKRPEPQKNDGNEGAEKPKSLKKKKKNKIVEDKEGRFTDPPPKIQKKTEEGFTIYTEDELGINSSNAGGTPLCPFDCECCF